MEKRRWEFFEILTLRTGSLKCFEHHATKCVSIMGFFGSKTSSASSPSSRILNKKVSTPLRNFHATLIMHY